MPVLKDLKDHIKLMEYSDDMPLMWLILVPDDVVLRAREMGLELTVKQIEDVLEEMQEQDWSSAEDIKNVIGHLQQVEWK